MDTVEIIRTSFLSPLVLAFLVGMAATLIKSELEFPQPVLNAISIYLVFSIALKGGTELSAVGFGAIWQPVLVTLALVVFVPSACYVLARRFIGLDIPNAAGIAAL